MKTATQRELALIITNWFISGAIVAGLCACGGPNQDTNQGKTSEDSQQEESSEKSSFSSGNPVSAPADYLGAVGKAKNHASKQANLANIRNAIRLFQTSEGRFPKNLNELVAEGYFPKIPPPPRGMRYVYNPQAGQVRLTR